MDIHFWVRLGEKRENYKKGIIPLELGEEI